jgi:hypothetical protein
LGSCDAALGTPQLLSDAWRLSPWGCLGSPARSAEVEVLLARPDQRTVPLESQSIVGSHDVDLVRPNPVVVLSDLLAQDLVGLGPSKHRIALWFGRSGHEPIVLGLNAHVAGIDARRVRGDFFAQALGLLLNRFESLGLSQCRRQACAATGGVHHPWQLSGIVCGLDLFGCRPVRE